jgi:hypothetical protein
MFERHGVQAAPAPLTTGTVAGWASLLAGLDRAVDDAERIEQLRLLEELKAAAAAAQARATADLDASQRERQVAAKVPASRQGAGIASQVALARRESPVRGTQHLGLAKALVHEMPHTLAALTAGRLSEWRATLLVRETGYLTLEQRRHIDAQLAADPAELDSIGDDALVAKVKELAYALDPHAVTNRAAKARAERRVTCRPAPDTMAYLTALLPVTEAVSCYAALTKAADSARSDGDPRTRGQVMADSLVERVTGQQTADAVPIGAQIVMTDQTLFGDGPDADAPAWLHGYGFVPAPWARRLLADSLGAGAPVWVRRFFTRPGSDDLAAMDSRQRVFPEALQQFLRVRDRTCRTPWCDAPIRHADHVRGHAAGGPTAADNGQGLCEQCDYAKQEPGWREITTPTGHSYRSTAPPPPGATRPRAPDDADVERFPVYLSRALTSRELSELAAS